MFNKKDFLNMIKIILINNQTEDIISTIMVNKGQLEIISLSLSLSYSKNLHSHA
jgi:hypothetical protein